MKRNGKTAFFMAWKILPAILTAFSLLFISCHQAGSPESEMETGFQTETQTETGKTEEPETEPVTEAGYQGPRPVMKAVSPSGEVDVVPENVRAYMERAEAAYAASDISVSVRVKGESFDAFVPVELSWQIKNSSEVPDIQDYDLVLSESAEFYDPAVLPCKNYIPDAELQTETVYNLKTGATYYWRIRALLPDGTFEYSEPQSFTTNAGPRILFVSGVSNARDAGGWTDAGKGTLKQGLVYRTAKPENADALGVKTMLEDLKIRTEIDLRNPETEEVRNCFDPKRVKILNVRGYSYTSFLSKTERAGEVFRVFADPESYPILVHCAGGADRTGVMMFVIKAYAGCPETELFMDYELTYNRFVTGYVTEDNNFNFPAFYQAFRKLAGNTAEEKAETFLMMTGISLMEASNIKAILQDRGGVFKNPPKARVRSADGKVTFSIDPRNAGDVVSVLKGEEKLPFTFENGELTVSVSGSGDAKAVFEDGSTLKFNWR